MRAAYQRLVEFGGIDDQVDALAGQGRALPHRDDRIGGVAALERALTRYRLLGVPAANDVAGLLAGASARAG